MDRRTFFSGVGSLAAAGAAAHFLNTDRPGTSTKAAPVAAAPLSSAHADRQLQAAFGLLPGSERWVVEGMEPPVYDLAYKLGVSAYDRAALAVLGYHSGPRPSFDSLELTINYRLSEPPYAAPYRAFRLFARKGEGPQASLPVQFDIAVPEGGTLGMNYRFDPQRFGPLAWGAASYALGGFGLGPGIHVIAGLSAETGLAPDLSQFTWGEASGELKRLDGGPADFDYLCLLLQPARA